MQFGDYILVSQSRLKHFKSVALYYRTDAGYKCYKPAGITIPQDKIDSFKVPEKLYIAYKDREAAYSELTESFYKEVSEKFKTSSSEVVLDTIITMTGEAFENPRVGTAIPARGIIRSVLEQELSTIDIKKFLSILAYVDYTTAIHSINVMALTLRYSVYKSIKGKELENLILGAFLHDIGKSELDANLTSITKVFNDIERDQFMKHSIYGHKILCDNGMEAIAEIALSHHERIDGSGYPNGLGKDELSNNAKLISIVDTYESLTSEDRLYQKTLKPYEALKLIREECIAGKFDFDIFSDFARSFSA